MLIWKKKSKFDKFFHLEYNTNKEYNENCFVGMWKKFCLFLFTKDHRERYPTKDCK